MIQTSENSLALRPLDWMQPAGHRILIICGSENRPRKRRAFQLKRAIPRQPVPIRLPRPRPPAKTKARW